jgi:glycerate kinase
MRVVFAPDSFKECLSAAAVARHLAAGWRRVRPHDDLVLLPMADGGEGTAETLVAATGGTMHRHTVTGPMGEPVAAGWALLGDGCTAVVEVAAASGLALVPPAARNPLWATTFGTGELVGAALDAGVSRLILALGGSATNDAGAGMAQALGYALQDSTGAPLLHGGAALASLASIDVRARHPRLAVCRVAAACDVDNPLCGPRGASAIFGPQKGATPAMVATLDAALAHWATVAARDMGRDVRDTPGAGAAGGLGAAAMVYLDATLRPGLDLVAEACGLRESLVDANLVVTGEGRLDAQSLGGKTPVGIARITRACGVPTVAIAGQSNLSAVEAQAAGFDRVHTLVRDGVDATEAQRAAGQHLEAVAEELARDWPSGS